MTYQEWKNKNLGKPLDWDGQYGSQCVDACRFYVADVLGYPQFSPVTGAGEIFDVAQSEYYTKVENTPTGIPPVGAIVIWKKSTKLPYGHVAIADEGSSTTVLRTLDQNWSGQKLTEEKHDYSGVRGWLIPKVKIDNQGFLVHNSDQWRGLVWYLELSSDPEHTDLSTVKSVIGGYKSRITDLENQLKQSNLDRQLAVTEVENQKDKLANQSAVCQREINQLKAEYRALKDTLPDVEKLKGSYEGRIIELEGDLRATQKIIGEKNLEIAELKNGVEVIGWIDRIVLWFKNRYK
jgi:DNA-binding transcriptional regulator/RsmH inhibitor MraZ